MIESTKKNKGAQTTNIAENLEELMQLHNITATDLAKKVGLPYNTIRRLAIGETTDPKYSTLMLLAEYFAVPVGRITGEKGSQPHMIPVFTWEQISEENISLIDKTEWSDWAPISISDSNEVGANAYALKSRKSMQPRIANGTLLIIDPDTKPIDGDMVLIKIKDTGDVSLRDLVIDPPSWFLQPLTHQSPPLTFDNSEHIIIGVVVLTIVSNR